MVKPSLKSKRRAPFRLLVLMLLVLGAVVLLFWLFPGASSSSNSLNHNNIQINKDAAEMIAVTKGTHHCLNADFAPKESMSVWTMLNDNKQYVSGAIKIGKSLKSKTKTPVDLVVMELEHKPLTAEEWDDLKAVGWQKCTVQPIPAPQKTRADLKEKFAVLHVWAMTVYKTVVFLDSDSYPQNAIDDLLHMDLQGKPVGVTKDIRGGKWVDTFNSGVLLLHPSIQEHERLVQLLGSGMVFEYVMSDQGFLNEVYKNNWHEIGFVNNANLALYRFERQFWDSHKPQDINIIHYTMQKPWKCKEKGPYGPICKIWHAAP